MKFERSTIVTRAIITTAALLISGILMSCSKAPENLQVVDKSASHFTLEWQKKSDKTTGFRIERLENQEWLPVGAVSSDITSFVAAGYLADQSYEHRVVALHRGGESASPAVSSTTMSNFAARKSRLIAKYSERQDPGSIIKLKNGDLVIYYSDMETVSDLAESTVSKKVSSDNGATWGERKVVFREKGMSLFMPGVIYLPNGTIGITYANRVPGDWFSKRVFRYSADEGRSWSEEQDVTDGSYDYSTGSHDRFYLLSNDRLVILIHSLTTPGGQRPRHLVTDVYVSDDNGETWLKKTKTALDVPHNPLQKGEYGMWECSIVEHKPGQLLMYGRTATSWLYKSESTDYGETWTKPEKVDIPQPLSPPYLKMIPGTDTIVMLNNPIVDKDHRLLGNRYVIASRISNDGGRTWHNYKQIEYHSHDWWYDYPCLFFDGDVAHISMRDIELKPDNSWEKVYLGYLQLPTKWFLREETYPY